MKRLIFRLSSLGDLILSQSILEPPYSGETHWVVAKEFEELVVGNPKISRVWSFDRRASGGLKGWISFLAQLRTEQFTEVLDVHSTLRTTIARVYFRIFSSKTKWRKISKERLKRVAYEVLKGACPLLFRPVHFAKKCALIAGGYGNERPDLRWILSRSSAPPGGRARVAVVPSSAWPGKEWPWGRYLEWLKHQHTSDTDYEFILMGTNADRSALLLRDALIREGIPITDGIGKYSLKAAADLLSACAVVVGADTGLLHLAEAVGTPVVTLFGPTRADFGFGPLDERSQPVQTTLWCSPCSKDGTLCFRPINRYACLKGLDVKSVENGLKRSLQTREKK